MKTDRELIDDLLSDLGFRKLVEAECGTPIKVNVNWESGVMSIKGPIMGRDMNISDTLLVLRNRLN